MRRWAGMVALTVTACDSDTTVVEQSAAPTDATHVVIDFVDGTSLADAQREAQLELSWAHPLAADESLAVATTANPEEVMARLRGHPLVEVVEPSIAVEALGFPDDPLYEQQWNLRTIHAEAGWQAGGGHGATVAVIDTGLTPGRDLAGTRLLKGVSVVAGEPDVADTNGHGTHVAGTIAQTTDNGFGAAGVAPRAAILPIKALGASGGGRSEWIATAIDEAADRGAHIINLSLGGARSEVIATAIEKARRRGLIVIAAAGNSGREGVSYPAALSGVVGVSAVGPDDHLSPYSSWGDGVSISAPGGDTRVEHGGIIQETVTFTGEHAFREFQGTSMAAPHVAGAAAVLWARAGGDAQWVTDALLRGAHDVGVTGVDPKFGHGRLDLRASLRWLTVRRNGLLFALGALAATLLGGLSSGAYGRSQRLLMTAAGAISAGGAFFLLLMPFEPPAVLSVVSHPLMEWPQHILPAALGGNAVVVSAAIPVVLTFILGPNRLLSPLVAGLSAGIGTHLITAAILGGLTAWPLQGWPLQGWCLMNGIVALLCTLATVGMARVRLQQDGRHQ